MSLTGRQKERISDIAFSLLYGVVLAGVGYAVPGYGESYIKTLGGAWVVFAGWLPIVMVALSILISSSDKRYVVKTRSAKIVDDLINRVMMLECLILVTVIVLFLFRSAHPIDNHLYLWTAIASTVAGAATYYMLRVFWYITLLAKAIANNEPSRSNME